MVLSFKYLIPKKAVKEVEIVKDIMWYTTRVYTMLLYEIKQGNEIINILRKYIKDNSPNQEIPMDNGREQRPIKKRVF